MMEKVKMDIRGELGDGQVFTVFLVCLPELPVLIDRDDHAGSHGGGVALEKGGVGRGGGEQEG